MSHFVTKVTTVYKVGHKTQPLTLYASRPQAGFPAPADDLADETLDLNKFLLKNPEATFYVRVEGNSMEKAGIYSGDILVVDRSLEPVSGRIVVAAIAGELCVKRLHKNSKGAYLMSEQSGYKPIKITDELETVIWGVVRANVHLLV